jgi:hypothetical protein
MENNFFQKIKYPFLLIIFVSIFLLALPNITKAVIDPFTPFKKKMEAIEHYVQPVALFLIIILFVFAIVLIILLISVIAFDWIIRQNLEMVSIHTDIVRIGWDFVAGIANMFLILIFIACAFAIILKIESFQVKKVLPMLIIVALLMNFSLVFIGMLIDVANIFYNTFLPPPETSLIRELTGPFIESGVSSVATQIAAIIASAKLKITPFVGPFFHSVFIAVIPIIILPNIIHLVLQTIISIILIIIFFLYIVIFAGRIFIIQILAILSPLAFLALILPQTKQLWDKWWKWLLEWLFVGIFLLFFLRLGFLLFSLFEEDHDLRIPISWFVIGEGGIGSYFWFYLFVIIYLGIALYIAKKFIPEYAEQGITAAKAVLTKGTLVKTAALGGRAMFKELKGGAREGALKVKELEEKEQGGESLTRMEKVAKVTGNWGRKMHHWAGTTPELERDKEIKQEQEELNEKFEDNISAMQEATPISGRFLSDTQKIARLNHAIEKRGARGIKDLGLNDEELSKMLMIAPSYTTQNAIKHRPDLIENEETREAIQRIMLPDKFDKDDSGEYKDKDIQAMISSGIITKDDLGDPNKEQELITRSIYYKIVTSLKVKDIENLTSGALNDKKWQESAALHLSPHLLIELARVHGASRANQILSSVPVEEIAKHNSTVLLMTHSPGAQSVGISPLEYTTEETEEDE